MRAPINVHAELLRYGGMGVYQRGGGRLILAEGAGPGGVEAGVPEFIDRQMELPYGHRAYFYMKGPFPSGESWCGAPALRDAKR